MRPLTAFSRTVFATAASLALAVGIAPAAAADAEPTAQASGFHVEDGRLLDANGNDFVMRGVNHPHSWFPDETGAIADIKSLGANTVRVVLSSGDRWTRNDTADVADVVSRCKENRLVCVLEVHDTTGYGEQSGAASLDQAVDYWVSVQDALQGEEEYVIVNIGNEPHGNSGYESWATDTSDAVQRMRSAGFAHTLMVDAPNWGQDWSSTMRDNAASVFSSDPDANTVFSIHMYGVYETRAAVSDYLRHFTDSGLPIVVGEFGFDHSDGDPDEDAVMAMSETLGTGYLGWSWSGNSEGVDYLDMVTDFDGDRLTSWGERIFNGENGIAATAEEATVYTGGTDPDPEPEPGPEECAADYRIVDSWQSGYQAEVTVTAGDSDLSGWQVDWSFDGGQSVGQAWNADVETDGAQATARNAAYNGDVPAGESTTFGFTGEHNGGQGVSGLECSAA